LNQKLNNNIFITGSSGFIGKNVLKHFQNFYNFSKYDKSTSININQDIVLHLAGKAHDFKNIIDPSEYYRINTELTKVLFDKFIESNAYVFITLSSVKAAADVITEALTEGHYPNPVTHYGKSKLLAEEYILSKNIPNGKRVYILRPCMVHGPGNKGNLNLLYNIVNKGLPWPLGAFENKRSFCSIHNLLFVFNELIQNDQIPSGIYNVADDDALSTNELVKLIGDSQGKKYFIWNLPKFLIKILAKLGDILKLPLNSERLNKLSETYIVSNQKLKKVIGKPFPISSIDGLKDTLNNL
jgi:nucleoside-diphosphate-sugar epimerase